MASVLVATAVALAQKMDGKGLTRLIKRSNSGQIWYKGSWIDPAVADFHKKNAGLRSYEDHEVPAYCERVDWPPRPTGVNNFAGHQPLPERCRAPQLAVADTKQRGPNGASTGECFQLDKRRANETQPVLPTLFMPGFPKCASTWLFECMHSAFIPETVCGRQPDPLLRRGKAR